MAVLLDTLSWVMLVAGGAFVLIGGIGILRLPDLYTRMHAASLTDTLGTLLILLGIMLQAGLTLATSITQLSVSSSTATQLSSSRPAPRRCRFSKNCSTARMPMKLISA